MTVRTGIRAVKARAGAGRDGAHVIELDDGSTVEGHAILMAVGRQVPLDDLGLEHYGLDTSGRTPPFPRDGRLRVADGLWVAGDAAGPELHTHQAHYQGGLAVRMALGEDVAPDYRALPRATYTDPEAAFVGVTLEAAREAGTDAFELVADFAKSTRGYGVEATMGHVTIVVDRATRELVGAAVACPDASAAMHECVVAIQARDPDGDARRGDPRVPIDLAHLRRPLRRRPARARAAGEHRQGLIARSKLRGAGSSGQPLDPVSVSGFDLDRVHDRLRVRLGSAPMFRRSPSPGRRRGPRRHRGSRGATVARPLGVDPGLPGYELTVGRTRWSVRGYLQLHVLPGVAGQA